MELARWFEEKKFMWDGEIYPDEKKAQKAAQKYQADGFVTIPVQMMRP